MGLQGSARKGTRTRRGGVYARVLVGYDGSGNADRALRRAVEIAKQSKGALRIVVAADTMTFASYASGGMYREFNDTAKRNADNLADSALQMARAAGLRGAYSSSEAGQPADMILTLATEYKADLVVVGRRGMRGLARFLMGSVSTAIINHAKCDVLVVK